MTAIDYSFLRETDEQNRVVMHSHDVGACITVGEYAVKIKRTNNERAHLPDIFVKVEVIDIGPDEDVVVAQENIGNKKIITVIINSWILGVSLYKYGIPIRVMRCDDDRNINHPTLKITAEMLIHS